MTPTLFEPAASSGATFSDCGKYRYRLWRTWDDQAPLMVWVMLNPSTADAEVDDPTIRKCQGFARRHHHGGVVILNLFAWRSTNPKVLPTIADPVGPDNDTHIEAVLRSITPKAESILSRGNVIAAWGADPAAHARGQVVLRRIHAICGRAFCLGTTQGGAPRHPLYPSYETPLVPL